MSNEYFNYGQTLIPGDLARAEDVENEFTGVEAGFDRLPTPRTDGQGFAVPIYVEDATEEGHAVTYGQASALELLALAHADAAEAAKVAAEAARDLAETYKDAAAAEADRAESANVVLDGVLEAAADSAADALASKNLAADWAQKGIGLTVDGVNTRSAYHWSDYAKQWASADYGVDVEGTDKSAKHWALHAASLVTGAKTYIGHYDASGGTYPIASPTAGDEGKYWIITVAGTLPLGAVGVGWELAINSSLAYEAANVLPGVITSVNLKTGPAVTLTPGDIGAAPSSHTHSTFLEKTDNLAALSSKPTARTNLGLGTVATLNTGTAAGQIPVRDSNAKVPGDITGAAASSTTATKLASSRTITLSGAVSGSASTDFSGNVNINTTAVSSAHSHTSIQAMDLYAAPFDSGSRAPRDYFSAGLCTVFVKGGDVSPSSGWPIDYGVLLNIPASASTQDGGALQILAPYSDTYSVNGSIGYRTGQYNNAGWSDWKQFMDYDLANSLYLAINGEAASATRLKNPRTITISGDISGTSPAFDGSSNITINASLTTANLLTKLKTVDGAGSGLDADTLDGLQASAFVAKADFNPSTPVPLWTGSVSSLATSILPTSGMYLINVQAPSRSAWVGFTYVYGANCGTSVAQFTNNETFFVSINDAAAPTSIRPVAIGSGLSGISMTINAVYKLI